MSLSPGASAAAAGPRDVVFLVDTSASQAGDYRTDAIGTLNSALAGLGPQDRVKLLAVDLNAAALTDGFVAPTGPEMDAALKKLDARVPLGATDMEKAITALAESYQAGSHNARAAVYIGDGMSTAHLLGTETFNQLAEKLAEGRIASSSCPVGPRVDRQLLGALAGNTGGQVIDMGPQAGGQLAAAADATVLWPAGDVQWPQGFEVYPTRMPPLRTDRDTVVIGTYSGQGPVQIGMTADGPAGPQQLAWAVQPGAPNEDNNYLVELVDRAKVDGGVSLPLVGSASLAQARQAVNAGIGSLSALARNALASGNLDNAEKLAAEALTRDPGNPEALAVQRAVAKQRGGKGVELVALPAPGAVGAPAGGPALEGDLNLLGDVPGGPLGGLEAPGGFAEAIGQQADVLGQVIQTQVQNAVNQARGQMGTDPEAAMQNLKLTLEMVRQTPDLKPEVRDQLVDVIQAALRAAEPAADRDRAGAAAAAGEPGRGSRN